MQAGQYVAELVLCVIFGSVLAIGTGYYAVCVILNTLKSVRPVIAMVRSRIDRSTKPCFLTKGRG